MYLESGIASIPNDAPFLSAFTLPFSTNRISPKSNGEHIAAEYPAEKSLPDTESP